jgi:hypothetical protein
MTPQGFPLWARRTSDDTVWIVVGWFDRRGQGWLPVMVPAAPATVSAATMQSTERFAFFAYDPRSPLEELA